MSAVEKRKFSSYYAPRRIRVNTPVDKYHSYVSNEVRTSKYSLLTFLPKNIFEQFHGLANFYFLGLIILQAFPEFKQVDLIIPTLPLVLIVLATALKDGIEDLRRHSADDSVNKSPTYVLNNWQNSNRMPRTRELNPFAQLEKVFARIKDWITNSSKYKDDSMKAYPDLLKSVDYIQKTAPMLDVEAEDSWLLSEWNKLHVGDFILLRNNDRIPADAIAISSGEPDCTCYIETKNLDGETNLKVKKGIKELAHIKSPKDCKELKGFIDAEKPNPNLYSFNGTFHYQDKVIPIGQSGLLLRGCVVRNTSWLIAVVVYTGNDTKIMLNSGPTPSKRSRIDKKINPIVVLNAFTLFLFCITCAVCSALYQSSYVFENAIILGGFYNSSITEGLVAFFNCLIVFQNIIPIALYISLEITKSIQSFFIHLDLDMFDEDSGQSVIPKSWNLCDDLGQIEYIFSDKTGTLTSNMMDFKKASIGGIKYGKWLDPSKIIADGAKEKHKKEKEAMLKKYGEIFDSKFIDKDPGFVDASLPHDIAKDDEHSKRIKSFFTVLAICHTVLVETPNEKDPNTIVYRAQSPDEAALVNGAKNAGFACLKRTENKVEIDFLGVTRSYTILHILEFNSDRKRMSVIVQRPEGDILLICKGADSVIYERLDILESEPFMKITSEHLSGYANDGLRTLCLAFRRIPQEEYNAWSIKYQEAQTTIERRDQKCDAVAEEIERNLILMGATAIEDKLQEGVPDSISLLAKAGIKLWVLTGDKVETAINIGFSCNLLLKSMVLVVIQAESAEKTYEQLKEALKRFWLPSGQAVENKELALIIDGITLKYALDPPLKSIFLELGCRCKAVLCCRVSPLQKALVVKLVREGLGAMCLAIGDGANDVSMIQEADIGIGIYGKEGLQAVMASDYSISQFRFLSKLLLVHGKWAYVRSSELVLNYFYKNIMWLMILFWHQFYCGFSVQLATEYSFSIFFNTVFTFFPTICVGMFDQDLKASTILKIPQVYLRGIRQEMFSLERFWEYMFHGVYQSLVCYFGMKFIVSDTGLGPNGSEADYTTFSAMLATSSLLIINIFGTCNFYSWTWINYFSLSISIFLWVIYFVFYSLSPDSPPYGITTPLSFYAGIIAIVFLALLPRLALKFFQQTFFPSDTDLVLEMQEGCNAIVSSHNSVSVELESMTHNSLEVSKQKGTISRSIENVLKGSSHLHHPIREKNVVDGFEPEPSIALGSASEGPTSPGNATIGKRTSTSDAPKSEEKPIFPNIGQAINDSVHKASQFFKHLLPESKEKQTHLAKASSIVYMNGGKEFFNTGFAFSHDVGMQDIITPNRLALEPIQEEGGFSISKKKRFPSLVPERLRNLSRTIQSALTQQRISREVEKSDGAHQNPQGLPPMPANNSTKSSISSHLSMLDKMHLKSSKQSLKASAALSKSHDDVRLPELKKGLAVSPRLVSISHNDLVAQQEIENEEEKKKRPKSYDSTDLVREVQAVKPPEIIITSSSGALPANPTIPEETDKAND